MIPQNENNDPRLLKEKPKPWLDRMQQKLETFYDGEVQVTWAFLENQISTLGTNVKKFCSELEQGLLIHPAECTKCANRQAEVMKLADKPMFHLEGSSAAVMPLFTCVKVHTLEPLAEDVQKNVGDIDEEPAVTPVSAAIEARVEVQNIVENIVGEPPITSVFTTAKAQSDVSIEPRAEASNIVGDTTAEEVPLISEGSCESSVSDSQVSVGTELMARSSSSSSIEEDQEEHAHWYVTEEYQRTGLVKYSSLSTKESCDGLQRAGSNDSLQDWELI